MEILILGGTGVMGRKLLEVLDQTDNRITVTSRSGRESVKGNVRYALGNAKELNFLEKLLFQKKYDAIVDFMVYSTEEFRERYKLFLAHTEQYIFISSARVYAQSRDAIKETTPRLLDSSTDEEYLKTDEYALAKARSEDLLCASKKSNYTIIRPSITYGDTRLQLGVLEKENWLYRALRGRSIVFSKDIASKYTAMTAGEDVARGIAAILGREDALGQIFHITSEKSYTWDEILSCYLNTLEKEIGMRPQVIMTDKSVKLKLDTAKYQVIYCRYFNRHFDNSKIRKYIDVDSFTDPMEGLEICLRNFLKNPSFHTINWSIEAWNDKAAHEYTPLKEIPSIRQKLCYLCRRFGLDFLVDFYKRFI